MIRSSRESPRSTSVSATSVSITFAGYTLGSAVIGAPVLRWLVPLGWEYAFVVGGALPILMAGDKPYFRWAMTVAKERGGLPAVMAEGRRVMGNIERVANLFLTKTVYVTVLALAVGVAQLPFPFYPRHLTLVSTLTIGVPAFFLALAPNARRARPHFLRRVLRFTIPAGVIAAAATFRDLLDQSGHGGTNTFATTDQHILAEAIADVARGAVLTSSKSIGKVLSFREDRIIHGRRIVSRQARNGKEFRVETTQVLVAPDGFKGSLPALQVATAIGQGLGGHLLPGGQGLTGRDAGRGLSLQLCRREQVVADHADRAVVAAAATTPRGRPVHGLERGEALPQAVEVEHELLGLVLDLVLVEVG